MDYTPLLIGRELRRIGDDEHRLSGLASHGLPAGEFLQWLRLLPAALGDRCLTIADADNASFLMARSARIIRQALQPSCLTWC